MATVILTSNTIAESVRGPARVGTLSIQDRPNEAFTFELANDLFEVRSHEENGIVVYELYVKPDVTFNFEAVPQFSLNMTVIDGTGNVVPVDPLVVTVTNVNEAPADIVVAGGTIGDNAIIGAPVATLTGEDPDRGDLLTYMIVDEAGVEYDNPYFGISGNQIVVKNDLSDAEIGPM